MHRPRQARKKTKTTVLLIIECKYTATKINLKFMQKQKMERKHRDIQSPERKITLQRWVAGNLETISLYSKELDLAGY